MKKTHFQKVGAFILSLIILVSALPISAFAAYESHSNMEYISGSASAEVYESLGYGFNALVDEEIKDTTLKYSSGNIINFDAVKASILTTSESKAEEKYSKTVQELMLKLGIDYTNQSSVSVPISAAKVGFSSKFSVNAGVNYKNATDSFYYYYNEETVKEKRSLQLPSALLAEPSKIISREFVFDLDTMSKNFSDEKDSDEKDKKCKEFFDRWGTHILISYNKGAILEYVATSETSGKELSASLGISYETGASVSVGSISAEATIKKSMDIEAEIKKNEIDASHKWFCMGGDSELIDVDSSNTSLIVDLEKEKWKDSIKDEKSVLLPQSTEWRAIWEFIPDSYYSVKNALQDYYKKTVTGKNAEFFSRFTNYSKVIGTELFYTSPTGYTSKITYQTDGTTKVAPGSKFNVVDLDADLNMVKFPESESDQYTVDKYGMVTMKATSGNVTVRVTDLDGKDIAGATKTFTVEKEGAGFYAGGYGDEERPYLISNATQFSNIRNHKDANYLLISDINLGTMLPIDEFGGILDGNGYTLSGWSYSPTTSGNIGLFASISTNGKVKNLTISGSTLHSVDGAYGVLNIGTVCGINKGKIENVIVTESNIYGDMGSIDQEGDSETFVGGICGRNNGTIEKCIIKNSTIVGYSGSGNEGGTANCWVGGITGLTLDNSKISFCSSHGNTIEATAKGKTWWSWFATHGACGWANIGGIVGRTDGANIEINNSLGYQNDIDGLVEGRDSDKNQGSLIGYVYSVPTMQYCYSENSDTLFGQGTVSGAYQVESLTEKGSINQLTGFASNGWIQGKDGHPTIAQDTKLEIVGGKRNYFVGEPLNLEDVTIDAVKNDNIKSRSKLFGGFKVSGYDPNKIGEQTLTVTYGKIDGTYTVNVKEPDISEIIISENPYKTSYFKPFEKTGFEGEKLDYSGLAVIAKYDDNHTEEIKFEDLILPESGYVTKSQTVEVEYRGHKAEYEIEAWDVLPSALEVIEGSYKKNYALGDDFDTAGLSVKLTYNNGNTEILGVEDLTIDSSDFDAERPNTYSIIVKYGELETFFDVIVGSIKRISIATNPNKTLYYSSEKKLIADGLSIDVLYDNGATKTVTKGFTVSGYDNTDIGKQDITVAYGGASTTFPIEVVAVEMTSVEISEYPKTSFYVGDEFTVSGLTLKVNYNDGNSKEISNGFTVKLDTFNVDVYPTLITLGTKKVVITYSENGNRKTTEYDIKVVTDYITELQIVQDPNKTTYNLWDEFSYSGMMVFTVYASGKAKLVELSKSMFSIQKFNEPGIQTVSLNYEGRSIDVICDVKAPVSIAVMKLPSKIEYEVGESFVADGIEISVYFPDKSSKTIDAASCSLEWPSTDTTGEKTVKVNYASLETVFNVIVKESVIDENAPQIVIGSKSVHAGDTLQVAISLKNADTLKTVALSDISFDTDCFELVSGEWKIDGSILSNVDIAKKTAVIGFENNTDCNGELFLLTFKVKEDAEDGTYPISCSITAKRKEATGEQSYSIASVAGNINITSTLKGDTNGDDEVNSDDAIYLLYYTLLPDLYPINQDGDFDGNGEVNSDDAIYLLYYTLLPDLYPLH